MTKTTTMNFYAKMSESDYSSQKQFCVKFEYLNFRAKNDVEYLRKDRISSTLTRHFWREVCLLSRYRVQFSIQFDEFSNDKS